MSAVAFVAAAQEAPAPSVSIIAPADGQMFEKGEEITLQFRVESFLFVDFKNNTEPFPGTDNAGHAHLWLDDVSLNHDEAKKLLSDDFVPLGVLPKGGHTVTIELARNHHQPYDPPVRTSVTFRVGDGGLFDGGFGANGGGDSMRVRELGGIALLAIGGLWFLVQKGAVKRFVKWVSWEKLGMKKKDSSPPQSPPPPQS